MSVTITDTLKVKVSNKKYDKTNVAFLICMTFIMMIPKHANGSKIDQLIMLHILL